MVEDMWVARGIVVNHGTIRRWAEKSGVLEAAIEYTDALAAADPAVVLVSG